MIQGEKLILREFKEEDLVLMHSWVNDETITKNLSFAVFPRTLDDSKKFLQQQLSRTGDHYINFVIAEKNDPQSKYIGSVGLKNIDYIHKKAEFAIVIGFKEYQGKGYGAEATQLIVKYGFHRLGLNKIYLKFLKFNESAGKAYQKAGFKFVCELKEDIYHQGRFHDQIYMEILKSEYDPIQNINE